MPGAMKVLVPLLLAVAGTAVSATRSDLNLNGRTAMVYVPNGHKNSPLVISMHGMGIPASMNQGMMKFENYADTAKERFITVYPQGIDSRWDLGSDKDVNFIVAIIDEMFKKYAIDKNRVYVSGFSMGGMMSWYLTCKIPDKIAAAVPGNGFPMGGMSGCKETRHVPVLHIHGNADDFVKYVDFVNSFLPAQRTRYGCPTNPVRTKPYPASKPTSGSYMDVYGPCVKGNLTSELRFLTVDGMIHDWATLGRKNENKDTKYTGKMFDVDGTYEAWNWMKTQSLTGSTGLADQARLSGQPVVKALVSEGRLELESDVALREVKVLDLQGKVQSSWKAGATTAKTVGLSVGQMMRGVYMLESVGDAGRTVQSVMVP